MKPFGLIQSIITTLSIIAALLFIVAAYSDSVSPNQSLLFSYLGLLFPVFLMLHSCFLLYWLILRKWMMLFVCLCSLFMCWQPISRYIPFHPVQVDVSSKNILKILTYNVMAFGYQDHTPEKQNEILQYISNSGADIVCMQEYMVGTQRNYMTQEKVDRALHMYPYYYSEPLVQKNRYSIGLAIFSKYPILDSRKILYDSSFNGSTIHEIKVKDKKLIVVNNHLESFKLTMEDRSYYSDFIKT